MLSSTNGFYTVVSLTVMFRCVNIHNLLASQCSFHLCWCTF